MMHPMQLGPLRRCCRRRAVLDSDKDGVGDLLAFGFDGTTPTTSWW
jgi:hypothetical protein